MKRELLDGHGIQVLRIAKKIAPEPGGQEQHVRELAESQSVLGQRNLLVFGRGAPTDGARAAYLRLPDTCGLPGDFVKGAAFSALAALRCRQQAASARVIHTHGSAGDLLAAILFRGPGRKIFHSFHATLGLPPHVRAVLRGCLPLLDGIFVVSPLIGKQLEELDCALPDIHVFTSAVSSCFFSVRPVLAPRSALMIGRLFPMKGFEVGLQAARHLVDRGLIDLVEIAGDGPEQGKLAALAASIRVPVRFHGMVASEDLARLMGKAAVVLVPSRTLPGQAEGSPTVILESWAAGVPVAAARSGGIPALARHGIDAVLADEGDPQGLAQAGEWAIARRQELVAAGHKRIQGYTWSALARKVLQAYELG